MYGSGAGIGFPNTLMEMPLTQLDPKLVEAGFFVAALLQSLIKWFARLKEELSDLIIG